MAESRWKLVDEPPAEAAPQESRWKVVDQPKPWQGSILPFSADESGRVGFDPRAGLLGSVIKPVEFVGDVAAGRVQADPRNPAYIGGALETALTYGPGSAASRVGPGKVQAPSREALDEASGAGFNAYRDSLQMYPGDEYRTMLQDAAGNLLKKGFHDVPESAQLQHKIIQGELDRVKNSPFVTSQDIDALRVQLGGKGLKGPTAAANQNLREDVFGFIEKNLPPNSPASVKDAVANYRQARHSEAVTRPSEATSELNIAKAQGPELSAQQTRTNIAKLVNKIEAGKGEGRGFSDTEANILRSANRATPGIDRAQRIGDALKWGGVGGGLVGGGGAVTALATGHPLLASGLAAAAAVPAVVGGTARTIANRGARRIADEADNAIRAQSPLAAQEFATAPPLAQGFLSRGAMPGAVPGGGVIRTPLSVMQNPAIAAAVAARLRERQPASPSAPVQYRVLPDGTIEEFM